MLSRGNASVGVQTDAAQSQQLANSDTKSPKLVPEDQADGNEPIENQHFYYSQPLASRHNPQTVNTAKFKDYHMRLNQLLNTHQNKARK